MNHSNSNRNYYLPAFGVIAIIGIFLFVAMLKKETSIEVFNTPKQLINQWQQPSPFNIPRRALAAVATNNHLYVIGGVDQQGNYVRQVEFTKISPDGELGQWKFTSALQQGRFYLSAATADGYLYALGGGSGELGDNNFPVDTVERAKILPDGSLGPWVASHSLVTPRRGLKTIASESHIYAIGGYNGIFLKSTEYAPILPDGNIGAWRIDPEESTLDRYIHSAANSGQYLYVLGGHVQNAGTMSYGDVEMAIMSENGSLSPWVVQRSRLLTPRFIASAFSKNNYIYIVAGHNGAQRLRSVEFAPVLPNGNLGQWQYTAPLNIARSAAAVVINGENIYILGGISDQQVLNSVEYAVQMPNGHLGSKPGQK